MLKIPKEPPVLPAYACRKSWWVWCPWCAALHCHTAWPGHRKAHCREGDSPYIESGYVLKLAGEVQTLTAARAGNAPLHGFLDETRSAFVELRRCFLTAWLPNGEFHEHHYHFTPNRFLSFVHEDTPDELYVEVDIDACTWKVVNTGSSQEELGTCRTGRGLHTLAELLFGVPANIAARRIAEIIGAGDPPCPPGIGGANVAA